MLETTTAFLVAQTLAVNGKDAQHHSESLGTNLQQRPGQAVPDRAARWQNLTYAMVRVHQHVS